ncbi:hypothetical protein ASG51_10055 [Methylobacterium sp. Leaf465]|uniref:hypothetical protein n=1 Tax=unclassified Methylobacterium TaxID=2615210 RepID=UPI0006FEB6B8|nr:MULTISPECIES: hypothetical protein [unclassified Methylobacterium]KQO67997.1 hypothetical protein ASF18_05915 [Methylobacterium sp. Leaf89]KQT73771.1 hypothetical protein ASG51_10055 [Methylobacterium sp. Leaf465]KQU25806.1 hypothetical protein ASG63_20175 [Methylobacterium sp. Leaf94]
MRSATGRLWTVLKATLGIGLLAALSLYSASVVDQRGLNPFAAALAEPATTGTVKASLTR